MRSGALPVADHAFWTGFVNNASGKCSRCHRRYRQGLLARQTSRHCEGQISVRETVPAASAGKPAMSTVRPARGAVRTT